MSLKKERFFQTTRKVFMSLIVHDPNALAFYEGSKPSPHEEKSQERKLRGRSSVSRAESKYSCDGVSSRKRTISSEDSSHTGTGSIVLSLPRGSGPGSLSKLSVTLKKKAKPSDDGNDRGIQEAHAEPRRANSRARSGHKRRRRSRSPADHPPPLRKSLVTSLRSLSEAIYEDLARVQAQQAQFPLTQEQLFALAQLRGPLCSAMQSCYALALQAAWAFPAQGWLLPAQAPASARAPEHMPAVQSRAPAQSSSQEGEGQPSAEQEEPEAHRASD
ncbi:protein FRG2-like [Oryctolagus cuniculus]|uniref:protein FRG2-like n=1 Tax=Oryctolagus cuniculus TaxID=9986 RepID=UPI00387A6EE1